MKRSNWRWVQRYFMQATAIAAIATGCGQGNGGCALTDGIEPLAAPLPKEAILENGIQIRLTNQGFAFVEQNLGDIVVSLIGDHICIPADSFGSFAGFTPCPSNPNEENNPVCDGAPGCRINFNVDSTDFELDQSGNSALLRTQLQMDFAFAGNGMPMDAAFGQTCDAQVSADNFFIDATIDLSVNAQNRQLVVGIAALNLDDLIDQLNINITSENGSDPFPGSVCFFTSIGVDLFEGLAGIIVGLFEDQVVSLLSDQIQNFVPNPPGIEGRIDIASILGGALPIPLQGQFELSMVAGGYARAEQSINNVGTDPAQRGLSLGMRTGINSDFTPFDAGDGRSTPHPCVRTLPLPTPGVPSQFVTGERFLERANEFANNTAPNGSPYDAGLGISEGFLNNFGFHMFNSGMLCISVGSDTIGAGLLSSDTLGLLLGSIKDLIKTPNGILPVFIGLRPQDPPSVRIGAGDGVEPLINIDINNMEVDLFALVDERLARLLTARTSLTLGVDVAIDAAAGTIIPTLNTDQLAQSLSNITVSNSELLAEPPDAIAAILPTLIQVAIPALANVVGPISVPSVGGFSLNLAETSIERVQAILGNNQNQRENFIGLFASLVFDASAGKRSFATDPIQIKAKLAGLQLPASFALKGKLANSDLPGIQLDLEADAANVEWQFRVDGGVWTPYAIGDSPVLKQPIFLLQGEHTIEVRGREVGKVATTSEVAIVKARIDTVEPKVKLTPTEDGSIRADISDVGTNFSDLEKLYRVDSGDWLPLPANGIITPNMMGDGLTVDVTVSDKAEHTTSKSMDRIRGAAFSSTTAACTVSPEGNNMSVIFAFGAVIGFLLVLRRRQKYLGTALLLAGAATSEGCACGNIACGIDSDCASLACGVGEAGFCGPEGFCACGEVIIENGDVGRFSDIAADGSEAVIVAYNTTFGDLVLARITPPVPLEGAVAAESIEEFDFVYVDGVPSGPVVGDPNKIRNGIREAGENVGQDASVAIDAQGNAHIAYLDVDKGNLKYARVGRDNSIQAVMTVDTDAFVGRYTDIIIGTNGNPQISYMAPNVGGFAQLRFVAANSAAPSSAAEWQQPIIADSIGAIDPELENLLDFPKGTGLFTSMDLRQDGRTRINYFDSINGDLKRTQTASANPTDFAEMATIDDPNDPNDGGVTKLDEDANGNDLGNIGKYTTLFVDGNDGFHQVEFREDTSSLIYFGSASAFVIETVDDGIRDEGGNPVQHKIGGDATVVGTVINGADKLFVAYHDGTSFDVNIAERLGDNDWSVRAVSGNENAFEGSKGFFTAITIAGNNPAFAFLVNYVIDQQNEETDFEVITVDLTQLQLLP